VFQNREWSIDSNASVSESIRLAWFAFELVVLINSQGEDDFRAVGLDVRGRIVRQGFHDYPKAGILGEGYSLGHDDIVLGQACVIRGVVGAFIVHS